MRTSKIWWKDPWPIGDGYHPRAKEGEEEPTSHQAGEALSWFKLRKQGFSSKNVGLVVVKNLKRGWRQQAGFSWPGLWQANERNKLSRRGCGKGPIEPPFTV